MAHLKPTLLAIGHTSCEEVVLHSGAGPCKAHYGLSNNLAIWDHHAQLGTPGNCLGPCLATKVLPLIGRRDAFIGLHRKEDAKRRCPCVAELHAISGRVRDDTEDRSQEKSIGRRGVT